MEFRTALSQIWTIARHSILQAIRMRMVIILVIFLMVLVVALPFLLRSDNTHDGQLRMVITYSTYLVSFLLSVLTLFLSAITLNTEIKNQHIFLMDPKPVSRGVVLLGKWLGVMLINLVLLAGMLAMSYGLVRYLARPMKGEPPQSYKLLVQDQVLTARRIAAPARPDLTERVEQEIRMMKEKGLMPEQKSEGWVRSRLYERMSKSAWIIPPGYKASWKIYDVPEFKDPCTLIIRFRHFGDKGAYDHKIVGTFLVNESGQPMSKLTDDFQVSKPHSFGVPSTVVREEEIGEGPVKKKVRVVEISYLNEDPSTESEPGVAALFPFEDGIQVMYPAASLANNYVRAGVMILLRLTFIAIVGIFASTFLSFPVAVLLSLVVFMIGHMADFVMGDLLSDLYLFGTSAVPPGTPLHGGDQAIRAVLSWFFLLFPNFNAYDITPALADGQVINAGAIWHCFLWLPLIRGGILAVAAWYIFRRRELAALTPNT